MQQKTILIEGCKIKFKLDAGADVNNKPLNIAKHIGRHNIITPLNKLEAQTTQLKQLAKYL